MKKTKIAVGVVVALGLIWTGGAWYTGKQLEANMDKLVARANVQLANISPDAHLTLSYQDFQRGVFTSHARFILQADAKAANNPLLQPGQQIVLNETIDHGPFPLAQLKKLSLVPAMASVHSELVNNDAVAKLFALTDGKSPLEMETRISYAGATRSDVRVLAMDYQNGETGERYATGGATMTIEADEQGDQLAFNGEVGSLSVTRKNQLDQPALFTFSNLKADAKSHLTAAGIRVGDQAIGLDKFTISVEGKEVAAADGLKGSASFSDSDAQKIAGTLDYSLDALRIDNKPFGQFGLTMKLDNFDAVAMKTFSENYQAQLQQVLQQPGIADNPELYQQSIDAVLAQNLPTLLKGNPHLAVAPLSWKNDKGESTFSLDITFRDPATSPGEAQTLDQAVARVLTSLDGKLVISQPMAIEIMKQVAITEGNPEEQAAKLAEQQVKGVAAMGQMFKLTTQQDNNIVSSLQYSGGQVTMNGEKMTLAQFLTRFMLGGVVPEGGQP
ncbi:YdgA family protein [Pantoea sp. 1.19]|uniref:YdgA family protein n=1 Tax=Pantoea sp. 1.19 TaxID=1925589 RepID=UPI000948914A|nr:YdgA family protein [Pantoea sp. 1.19]